MSDRTYSVTGLNLRYFNLGEADRIFTVFTREKGLIRIVTKGIRKPTSRFGGRMDLLRCNDLLLRKGRNLDVVVGCESVCCFPGLLKDFDRLTQALYWSELVEAFIEDEQILPEIYDLLLESLTVLEYEPRPAVLNLWFELRLLATLGYQANLSHCVSCDRPPEAVPGHQGFDLRTGSVLCGECRPHHLGTKLLSATNRSLLQTLSAVSLPQLAQVEPASARLPELQKLLQAYIMTLSEKKLKTVAMLGILPPLAAIRA